MLRGLAVIVLGFGWSIIGPITYIIAVVDTWHGRADVWLKIVINLTLDAFLAVIWPVTWAIWLFDVATHQPNALHTVFGW